jgi:hypothetical protein
LVYVWVLDIIKKDVWDFWDFHMSNHKYSIMSIGKFLHPLAKISSNIKSTN